MARPIWNGSISFGLVAIPVKLYSATTDRSVRFHQIDSRTGSRVRQKRVSETDGTEVPYQEIVKGYELSSGRYVTISDEEMASLDPKASRTIDLMEFVDLDSIDPIYYESAYYLAPDPATPKPYALLLRAMDDAAKVGIARFVMRGKERLCAIRADGDKLVLSTMRYADEVRGIEEIEQLEAIAEVDLTDKEVAMAGQLIASLDAAFDPDQFHDEYREKVQELIARKQEGDDRVIETPEAEEDNKVIDLMAALEASVADAKSSRRRHPTGREETEHADDDAGGTEAAGTSSTSGDNSKKDAAKGTTKKGTAKKPAAKKAGSKSSARKSA